MQRFVSLVIFFCFYYGSVAASNCFPDYCQTATKVTPTPGVQCLLTKVQKGGDCSKLKFEDVNPDPPENVTAKFSLNAYVYEESNSKVTAFNFSVTDIDFYGLTTRYQNLMDENQSACRHIWIFGNETYPAPKELYVSCPFSDIVYETLPYQLEYLVTGKGYKYSKQYIFNVPQHKHMEESVGVRKYVPFVYIDKTYQPHFSLHIQSLPEIYNVTQYRIAWINNDTNSVIYTGLLSVTSNHDISYNFTGHTGSFYFKIAAVHPDCGEYGCANNTTPCIVIRKTSHRLLIMIISTVWIPPVILYVLYHLYKLYKKRVFVVSFQRREKPKCLLVYSPTRLSHLNVMIELAKYLRNCHVDAMLDILDCTDTTEKNWCNAAFQTANIVLIVSSAPAKRPAFSTIYQNNDNYLLRLVKETMFENEKRYYKVQLPYCELNTDIDIAHLNRFCLPQELPKLVEAIHRVEYVRYFLNVSDKDFLDSVELANLEIFEEDAVNAVKEKLERDVLENVLERRWNSRITALFLIDTNVGSQSHAISIDRLNLLGESRESEQTLLCKPSTDHDNAFRIDHLNL